MSGVLDYDGSNPVGSCSGGNAICRLSGEVNRMSFSAERRPSPSLRLLGMAGT